MSAYMNAAVWKDTRQWGLGNKPSGNAGLGIGHPSGLDRKVSYRQRRHLNAGWLKQVLKPCPHDIWRRG